MRERGGEGAIKKGIRQQDSEERGSWGLPIVILLLSSIALMYTRANAAVRHTSETRERGREKRQRRWGNGNENWGEAVTAEREQVLGEGTSDSTDDGKKGPRARMQKKRATMTSRRWLDAWLHIIAKHNFQSSRRSVSPLYPRLTPRLTKHFSKFWKFIRLQPRIINHKNSLVASN